MKILISNPPWYMRAKGKKGIRAGSRWPFTYYSTNENLKEKYVPFPFEIAYSASILETNGFEVYVIDALAEELNNEKYLKRVEDINPDLIVITCSTPSIYNDYILAERIKDLIGCDITFVGAHVSALPKEVLSKKFIDYGLIGEYELTLLELVGTLDKGRSLNEVKGLAFRENNKIKINDRRPLIDLNELPRPAWHLFNMELYNQNICKYYPNFQLITSRGCPYKCIFCIDSCVIYGPVWRARKIELVLEELEYVLEKYSPRQIWFDDSLFTVDKKRVKNFCNELKENGIYISWGCMTSVNLVDEQLLKEMWNAGCIKICYGIESGSNKLLNLSGKPYTLEKAEKTLRVTKKIGIDVHITSMFGLPGETTETAKETLNLTKFGRLGLVDSIQSSIATPFPGTNFFEISEKNGWLITKDWSKYDGNTNSVVSYENLSNKDIEKFNKLMRESWTFDTLNLKTIPKKILSTFEKKGLLTLPFLIKMSFNFFSYKLKR